MMIIMKSVYIAVKSTNQLTHSLTHSLTVKNTEGCTLSTYFSLEHFRYFRVFEFLQVKSDARTLREALGFQLQLYVCEHEIMIAAKVSTWNRSCVCFVEAGFEPFGSQDEFYLLVDPPVRGRPDCCSRQLMGASGP